MDCWCILHHRPILHMRHFYLHKAGVLVQPHRFHPLHTQVLQMPPLLPFSQALHGREKKAVESNKQSGLSCSTSSSSFFGGQQATTLNFALRVLAFSSLVFGLQFWIFNHPLVWPRVFWNIQWHILVLRGTRSPITLSPIVHTWQVLVLCPSPRVLIHDLWKPTTLSSPSTIHRDTHSHIHIDLATVSTQKGGIINTAPCYSAASP